MELNDQGGPISNSELNQFPPELMTQVEEVFARLGNDMITSLVNNNKNITVEEATKNFGRRYGFYQQEIKDNK